MSCAGPSRPRVCLTGVQGARAADDPFDDALLPADDNIAAGRTQQNTSSSALADNPASAWSSFDVVDLAAEFCMPPSLTPVPTMQSVPAFLRAGPQRAFVCPRLASLARSLHPWHRLSANAHVELSLLARRLLLHRPPEPGTVGRETLLQRVPDFLAGRWDALLSTARAVAGAPRASRGADVTDAADAEAAFERRTLAGAAATGACRPPQLSARLACGAHRCRRHPSSADCQARHRC